MNDIYNSFNLERRTVKNLKNLTPGAANYGKGASTALQTVYHEATHAYLDLREYDTEVASLIKAAEAYYQGAKMMGSRTGKAPERLTQEAAATYVGHRVSTWWSAMESIITFAEHFRRGADVAAVRDLVEQIRPNYNKRIASHVHGYEPGRAHGVDHQVETKKTIYPPLKEYCDKTILEGKIPDNFNADRRLREPWSELVQELFGFPRTGR